MNAVTWLLTGVLAIVSTPLVAEPIISELTPVSFGRIIGMANSTCGFNGRDAGLSGNACLDSLGIPGHFTVTATANQSYTITLFPAAGPTNQISYLPLLADGRSSATIIADAEGRFTLEVGGSLSINSALPTAEVATDFMYTIRIDSN